MKIDTSIGILEEAKLVVSPNCDDRPDDQKATLLVIHNISLPPREFGGPYINQLFCNQIDPKEHPFFDEIKDLRVSSHLLIRRTGEVIQYVPFHKRAWHAGISEFEGETCCNDFSIGIEMEGTDDLPYEEIQYQKLAEVTREIINKYPNISKNKITGHCHIAPNRKTDPGDAFDWGKYKEMI